MRRHLILWFGLLFFSACSSKPVEIEGFEAYIWKRDKFGCKGTRAEIVEVLLAKREKVIGLDETEILTLLGKPDEQEIYSRKQKFLIYYLEPNQKCTAPANVEATAKALNIRLSAIGVANELYISRR